MTQKNNQDDQEEQTIHATVPREQIRHAMKHARAETPAELPAEQEIPQGRYILLRAGDAVWRLDSYTGETCVCPARYVMRRWSKVEEPEQE